MGPGPQDVAERPRVLVRERGALPRGAQRVRRVPQERYARDAARPRLGEVACDQLVLDDHRRLRDVQGAGFRVQGAGCRVQGAGFRVQGSGCRVQG